MDLDENGCPTELNESGSAAKHCPPVPCRFCTGNSAVLKKESTFDNLVYMTSWEYCQDVDTCSATIDWEKVYGRD